MGKKKKRTVEKIDAAAREGTAAGNAPFSLTALADNPFIHAACLIFLVIIVYANTVDAPFQWDETTYISDNPIVKNLHYFRNPPDARGMGLYNALMLRYTGYLTFALDYRTHGTSVAGYHIVNTAIHAANSILVYLFVILTFRTPFMRPGQKNPADSPGLAGPAGIAFFSAAIFAVHPLQTEAVTYVFQRFASLAAFFYLLSLVAYIKSRTAGETRTEGRGLRTERQGPLFYYGIALVSAVLAMKTKENAFTLPLVIVLYEYCFFTGPQRNRLLRIIPMLLTLAIIPATLMALKGTHHLDPGTYGGGEFSRTEYFLTQFRVLVTYLRLLFLPAGQNFDYDYPVFRSFFAPPVVLSFVFLAALFGLGVYLIIRAKSGEPRAKSSEGTVDNKTEDAGAMPYALCSFRLMGFGILWFFITLSVESGIIPIPMVINEYRMYLPSVGVIVCAVSFAWSAGGRPPGAKRLLALSLVIALLSIATHTRNELWSDPVKLWEDTVNKSPAKARTHFNLANHYAAVKMYDPAVEQYMAAVRLKPDYAEAYNNLGSIYQDRGMPEKATEQYLMAAKLSPGLLSAHNNLGNIYQARNMPYEAEKQYLISLKLKPDFAEGHYNLGLVYQRLGQYDKAVEQYTAAIGLAPDYSDAHNNLGAVYQINNMLDKAVEQYTLAVGLKPDFPEARFNLGLAYYKLGQMDNARKELTECLQLKPDHEKARDLLKALYR